MILGSFGLVLGSFGLGIVVWRNVRERMGELALLRAVGFNKKSIKELVLAEHAVLLTSGILIGILAALLASLPSILTPGSGVPFITILILMVMVIANGFIWTWFAASFAIKEDLYPTLRKE
jgi:ABC-type antimicrobial peptide transport system permease subunit